MVFLNIRQIHRRIAHTRKTKGVPSFLGAPETSEARETLNTTAHHDRKGKIRTTFREREGGDIKIHLVDLWHSRGLLCLCRDSPNQWRRIGRTKREGEIIIIIKKTTASPLSASCTLVPPTSPWHCFSSNLTNVWLGNLVREHFRPRETRT